MDVGTSGTKVSLLSQSGQMLATTAVPHGTASRVQGPNTLVEQDPSDWLHGSAAALRSCIDQAQFEDALEPKTIKAVAVTGQMQDVILISKHTGEPVRPAILYSDSRASAEAREVMSLAGDGKVAAITGSQQGASSLLAKLRWLDVHEPHVREESSVVLFGGHDYVVYRLCGRAVTDTTTASTTGLVMASAPGCYATELMEAVGLAGWLPKLPEVVPPDEPCGYVPAAVAHSLGVPEIAGLPVFHSCGDAGAATIGCGAGVPGPLYAYIGTSGWVAGSFMRGAETLAPSPPGVFTLAHPSPGLVFRTGSMMTAGGNLSWALGALSSADGTSGVLTPQDADELAAKVPVGARGLIYLPHLAGERCPMDDPLARGAFIGLSPATTRGALVRAVMEGVAFGLLSAQEAMTGLPPPEGQTLRLVGGGAKSSLWPKIMSGVFRQPVEVLDEAQEVGVRGAAILAGRWLKWHNSITPGGHWVQPRHTFKASRADMDTSAEVFQVYNSAYPALKDVFVALANLHIDMKLHESD